MIALRKPLRAAESLSPRAVARASDRGWHLGDCVNLTAPVVQATLSNCDGPRLAAAVSRAGGLGTLTVNAPSYDAHCRRLDRLRTLTGRPTLLAFTAEWEPEETLLASFERGFTHFQVFWWNGGRLARRIHQAGGCVYWQVGSADQAREALDAGADVLIAQGSDAGGQVRSCHPLSELIARIRALPGAAAIPLIAGGGLADRADVRATLADGADAALLGTRFLLSHEADAPLRDKRRLLRADAASLTLDPRLIGEWPCAPRRRLSISHAEDRACAFAGVGLSRIHTLLPAGEIVRRLTP